MKRVQKPKVFIGSSSEGLGVARSLERSLERDARVSVWDCGTFEPSATGIESLLRHVDECEFGVFVLSSDDRVLSRGCELHCPRDNVIFELGLFVGRLGRERTFIIYDREAVPKLPSDLAGVTAITFSGKRFKEDRVPALSPVAESLRERMASTVPRWEVDILKALLSFVPADTKSGESYSAILSRRYDLISAKIMELEQRPDLELLLQVKQRLAEYFEHSAEYKRGIEFGRRYVRVLSALGEQVEALWCSVKLVGYLLVLKKDHGAGRRELLDVAREVETWTETEDTAELLAYCYRYLSISYLRDKEGGDIEKARAFLRRAVARAGQLPAYSKRRRELEARHAGNQGNIALESDDSQQAVEFHAQSLRLFEELEDDEHIGIEHLKLAES